MPVRGRTEGGTAAAVTGRYLMEVPMAEPDSRSGPASPQEIVLKGEREIRMGIGQSVEFHQTAAEEAIKEMIDNLEGYLYVTAPVLRWEGP